MCYSKLLRVSKNRVGRRGQRDVRSDQWLEESVSFGVTLVFRLGTNIVSWRTPGERSGKGAGIESRMLASL